MVHGRVMFGEIVSQIVAAFAPVDVELALDSAVLEPIKAHVDGFGAALFDSVINDAGGTTVVDLEGCRWLGMAHFVQDDAEGNALAGVEETGSQFGFSGGSENNI
jgi:hypothetical protein